MKCLVFVFAVLALVGCTSPRGSIKCDPPTPDHKVHCIVDLDKAKAAAVELKQKL